MHGHGFIHRDLKPENIMVDGTKVKLTDFGTVKNEEKPFPYTQYVSTRWYRAPEFAVRSKEYDTSVDIFALGCIMAELYLMKPIFPGNCEVD